MNIREAILKAADYIENNPDDYCHANRDGHCMLWHIGRAMGCDYEPPYFWWRKPRDYANDYADHVADSLGFSGFAPFVDRVIDVDWRLSPITRHKDCAKALRLYADKYHPNKGTNIPKSVLDIFRVSEAA